MSPPEPPIHMPLFGCKSKPHRTEQVKKQNYQRTEKLFPSRV